MSKPLEGIRVVELANYVAAPIVGRMLADMGAEVVKIEGRGGDAWRNTSASHTRTGWDENPLFDLFNVGKKSLSLNLKAAEGKDIFFRLLEKADIPEDVKELMYTTLISDAKTRIPASSRLSGSAWITNL